MIVVVVVVVVLFVLVVGKHEGAKNKKEALENDKTKFRQRNLVVSKRSRLWYPLVVEAIDDCIDRIAIYSQPSINEYDTSTVLYITNTIAK